MAKIKNVVRPMKTAVSTPRKICGMKSTWIIHRNTIVSTQDHDVIGLSLAVDEPLHQRVNQNDPDQGDGDEEGAADERELER